MHDRRRLAEIACTVVGCHASSNNIPVTCMAKITIAILIFCSMRGLLGIVHVILFIIAEFHNECCCLSMLADASSGYTLELRSECLRPSWCSLIAQEGLDDATMHGERSLCSSPQEAPSLLGLSEELTLLHQPSTFSH